MATAVKKAPARKAAAPAITSEVVMITPELAGKWLNDHNVNNRLLRNRWVDELIGIIERDEWRVTNQGIGFDINGVIADGQHRLWAIHLAPSGKSVPCLVVRNLPPESQMAVDIGARRNLADQLKLLGYANASNLAAAINMSWKIDNNEVRGRSKPTFPQALAYLKANQTLTDSVKMANNWHRRLPGSPATIAALLYQFESRDGDAAEAFFHGVVEAEGLTAGSPMLALRRHLETNRTSTLMMMALVIKAWNYYLEGKQVDRLMWRPVGKQAEDFPVIQGG